MSNANIVTSTKLGVDFYTPTTTRDHKLGSVVLGTNGSRWVYVQASGAIAQYSAVAVDESGQAAALTKALADAGHSVGFAQAAFADDEYGWVCISATGGISVLVKASCAADGPLYTSASAGVLDDTSTSQTLIQSVVITTAASASGTQAEVCIAPAPHVEQA